MICPKCQKNLPANSEICAGCGTRLFNHPQDGPSNDSPTEKTSQARSPKAITMFEAKITKVAKGGAKSKVVRAPMDPQGAPTRVVGTVAAKETKVFTREEKPIHGWLVVIEGKRQWEQLMLSEESRRLIIGSGADADIRFQEEGVEPIHTSLRLERNRLVLTDLDTSVGTLVEGEKIVRKEIEDGTKIQIGSVVLKYRKL